MLSIDTETTGLDLYHGARPYLVTVCDENAEQTVWEWSIDPETRMPQVSKADLREIADMLQDADGDLVFQNSKFDVAALASIGLWKYAALDYIWPRIKDTLIAGHLLNSVDKHDLTTMATRYLRKNILKWEMVLKKACMKSRTYCRSKLKHWRIAKAGLPDMPSAGKKCWKFDTWLPRTLAIELDLPQPDTNCGHRWSSDWYCKNCGGHRYWCVVTDYANMDSAVTVELWKVFEPIIRRRGLWEIFTERMKVMRISYEMEKFGVSVSKSRLISLTTEYRKATKKAATRCANIAEEYYDFPLELPKGGTNNSLREFVFEKMKLPVVAVSKKTGNPSVSKNAIEVYRLTLNKNSVEGDFINNLHTKRMLDTALQYMRGYQRFWHPNPNEVGDEWHLLHPFINPTGTNTLRWSSSNPNEQNISKKKGRNLRNIFGPAPDREWYYIDAENIELRIPSYESGEEELIALFERPKEPPFFGSNHMLIFSILHPDKWQAAIKEVGFDKAAAHCKDIYADTWYQYTKNGNFAVQYGAVDRKDGLGTADKAYKVPGAQSRIAARFARQEALNQKWIGFANLHGYVETMPDKTVNPRKGYPVVCPRTEYGIIRPTVPLNYHVQSTAMWWMMKAMIRCHELFAQWNREAGKVEYSMVMQVHDELVFDFPRRGHPINDPKNSNLGRIKEVARLMRLGGDDIGVPTPVSVKYTDHSWADGVSIVV